MKSFLKFINEQNSVKYQWEHADFFRTGTIAYEINALIDKVLKHKRDQNLQNYVNELAEYLKSKFNNLDFEAYVDKRYDTVCIYARRYRIELAVFDFEDPSIKAVQEFLDKVSQYQ